MGESYLVDQFYASIKRIEHYFGTKFENVIKIHYVVLNLKKPML